MCVIDTKEAMRHGLAWLHPLAKASVKRVAGAIADDIFRLMLLTDETQPSHTIPALRSLLPSFVEVSSSTRTSDASSATGQSLMGTSIASSASSSSSAWIVPTPASAVGAPGIPEWYREGHKQAETDEWLESRDHKLRKRCDCCKARGLFYCMQCQKCFCKGKKLCFCMYEHICASFQQTHWTGEEFNKEYAGWLASQEEE
jgi:hypothetical protein